MPAPKGNAFWTFRKTHGRAPKFTLEEIEREFEVWLDRLWVNPIRVKQKSLVNGRIKTVVQEKIQMPTLEGFQAHLGMAKQTWINYKAREGFLDALSSMEGVISHTQQAMAAMGICKETIVMRIQGLSEKTEHKVEVSTHEEFLKKVRAYKKPE